MPRPTPEPFAEKRQYPRAPIGVIIRVQTGETSRHYYSRNISAGGAFLLADEPLAEETRIAVEVYLPLVPQPVRATAEVVWVQRQEPTGFAIQFKEIGEAGRDAIRWVVDRYLGDLVKG
jgi:uncharacterized protein (TIGR02266 family)